MPAKGIDRRIQRTLHLLQNALVELIDEKAYDDVTIQEILDKANVGRSTFYTHFENKDQLLYSILVQLNERFEEGIKQLAEGHNLFDDNSANMPYRIVQFVEENHRLFKAMLGKSGHSARPNPFSDYLFTVTREHFRSMLQGKGGDAIHREMAVHYYASAFIGVLVWWVENNMSCPAKDFAQRLNEFTLPGLKTAFEN
jgi:AcrR family transcriptional regulator